MQAPAAQTQLMTALVAIARAAGEQIMQVYTQADVPAVTLKADNSPLTDADRRAHALIVRRLHELTPAIPVLSEEAEVVDFARRQRWSSYWLVDPLDGTKEFVQRNGEFTVNIARIDQGQAVMGVVHVPVTDTTYTGIVGEGASVQTDGTAPRPIQVAPMPAGHARVRVVASRHHRDAALADMLAHLQQVFTEVSAHSVGSSLKICLLAEGKADLYPRLAPTSEWDTAAAHAILKAAGGELVTTAFSPLRYNQKESLLNPYFLALADLRFNWQAELDGYL